MNRLLFFVLILSFLPFPLLAQEKDYENDFLNRYKHFISTDERKAFEKLETDEEREAFIRKFWLVRDTDPNTPDNEFKNEVDIRLGQVDRDIVIRNHEGELIRFRQAYGRHGELAQVYIMHGPPDFMDMISGREFVDLLVWIYFDNDRRERMRFLFYDRNEVGQYELFERQDPTLVWALSEISNNRSQFDIMNPAPNIKRIYNELEMMMAFHFIRALARFSEVGLHVGEALAPPTPPAIVAEESGFHIRGLAKIPENLTVHYSDYHSMIPGRIFSRNTFATIVISKNGLDWAEKDEKLVCSLKLRIFVQELDSKKMELFERDVILTIDPDELDNGMLEIRLRELENLPVGRYRISVHLKNNLTKKYNSWIETLVK